MADDTASVRTPDDLEALDAVATAALIRSGEVSAAEVIDAAIARIEDRNPDLNAVIHTRFDEARAEVAGGLPDGPFTGVPMLLKDLWPGAAGEPFHLGVQGLKDAGYTATVDANIVRAYRAAGFVILGRTNTPELGLTATTEPLAYGPTRNPWNRDHGPGGSSGGAAAAVASGMLPAANASDGGGSIRIPAAMCGLVGLKPSRGRLSMGPLQDEWGNSVQHVVCHTVRDSAAIMDATAYPFPGDGVVAPTTGQPYAAQVTTDPGSLRIGFAAVSPRAELDTDPDVEAAVRATAVQLEALGHRVSEDSPAGLGDQEQLANFSTFWVAGAAASLDRLGSWIGRELTEADVEPATWAMAQAGRMVGGPDVISIQGAQMSFRRQIAHWWDDFDLLLTPTCLRPAPVLGELASSAEDPMGSLLGSVPYAAFTSPFNITGQPGISLPLAMTSTGLPIGIQLVAAYGREDLLFQIAGQLEAATPWSGRRAPGL